MNFGPIMYALTGNMLGDGFIGFKHKDKNGKYSGNALFAITQKNYEYISYLYFNIYSSIVTPSLPRP
jgi:hypothetical protein